MVLRVLPVSIVRLHQLVEPLDFQAARFRLRRCDAAHVADSWLAVTAVTRKATNATQFCGS